MENKLEQLLNSLIKRWRVPFWDKRITNVSWKMQYVWTYNWLFWSNHNVVEMRKSTIEICSKSSWLWQFVCDREHRFIDERNYDGVSLDRRLKNPYVDYDGVNTEYEWITVLDYQYWLIESSLKDESELESFILDNIKVEWLEK